MAICIPRPFQARHSQFPSLSNSNPIKQKEKRKSSIHRSLTTEFTRNCLKSSFFSPINFRTPMSISAAASGDDKESKLGKNIHRDRSKWNPLEMATAGAIIGMHLLCVLAPFTFNWAAFGVAVGLYLITGLLGITLSFHRNLSHRSFKLPEWIEYSFAYCGVQALQGDPISWVSTHRYHHQFTDGEKDPHSPLEGFWFSHVGWLFDTKYVTQRCGKPSNVGDLEKVPFYRFIKKTYAAHPVMLGALLYAIGGLPYVVWGMGVRIVWVYHITWLVNSACHVWGSQAWNTGDLSRNNWWVAVFAFGEGWHNNHHAFEYSARHGLEWWQMDMTWCVVRLLEAVGLATHVRLPSIAHKQRMSFLHQK